MLGIHEHVTLKNEIKCNEELNELFTITSRKY